MEKRPLPCLCIQCPDCGSIFKAFALDDEFHNDEESNKERLNEITRYASQGYNVSFKDVNEFSIEYCQHLKTK